MLSLSGFPKRLMCPGALALIPLLASAEPSLKLSDVLDRVQRSETLYGSYCGSETVSVARYGVEEPDLSDERLRTVLLSELPEGTYRWYVNSGRWWMVKDLPETSPSKGPGTRTDLVEEYHGRILAIDGFRDANGGLWFGAARLSDRHDQAYLGPMVGRRWFSGTVSGMMRGTTAARLSKSGDEIEIEGVYDSSPIHFTVAPRYGYRVTRMLMHPTGGRFGFTIPTLRKVQGDWMPVTADVESGNEQDGKIVRASPRTSSWRDSSPTGRPFRFLPERS